MSRVFREMADETALCQDATEYDSVEEKKYFGKIVISRSDGKNNGNTYFTLRTGENLFGNDDAKNRLSAEIGKVLHKYFRKYSVGTRSKVLVVGLGNEKVTVDRLGSAACEKLFVTSHVCDGDFSGGAYGNLCYLKANVGGVTGIESFDLISGAVKTVRPDFVIVVDTLACSSLSRLGCCVQLSDGGIEPGGGVGNAKRVLSEKTLHVPILAIGVPLVIYVGKILAECCEKPNKKAVGYSDMVVSARDTDFLIEDYAYVISKAINSVVHREKEIFF